MPVRPEELAEQFVNAFSKWKLTNVFKNKIYGFFNIASSNPTVALDVIISAGTTHNVFNNIIGDLRATAANAANPLIGLNFTGGTTINVYYNTVWLNGRRWSQYSDRSGIFHLQVLLLHRHLPCATIFLQIFYTKRQRLLSVAVQVCWNNSQLMASASNNNLFYARRIT